MPTSEDDFGRVGLKLSLKAPGACPPAHCIGGMLNDLPAVDPPRPRDPELRRGCMETGSVYCTQGFSSRRVVGPVYNGRGEATRKNRPSSGSKRPESIRHLDFKPTPLPESSKRCYAWTHRPHGYENPDQWEDPPALSATATGGSSGTAAAARPTHPVCSAGVVALEHKRAFPEIQRQETFDPGRPRLAQAPQGSWGGWGRHGEPGRRVLVSPWDSLLPKNGGDEAECRFSDARKKAFPHLTYSDTTQLTRWHLNPRSDIDPVALKRVHVNMPLEARGAGAAAAAEVVAPRAAGQPSNAPVEGSALAWYDAVRAADLAAAGRAQPHTAR